MADLAAPAQPLLKTKRLFDFQITGVFDALAAPGHMLCFDAGTGKSVTAIAVAALRLEQGEIDRVLVICERNKMREWVGDFEAETDLALLKHHGAGRQKRLEKAGLPTVLVTTYETAKRDMVVVSGRKTTAGWLLGHYLGSRVLVVYDESAAKLRNRSSGIYKSQDYILRELRKHGSVKALALTATPLERGYEDAFNQLRLLDPGRMPLVKDFESRYVRYRDMFGRPTYDHHRIAEFVSLCQPMLTRKRKTDPDVVAQFPAFTETFRYVEMGAAQRGFYRAVEELILESEDDMVAWNLLRQIAGHPASIIHSAREGSSEITRQIVQTLGEDHLRSIPSAKAAELKAYLEPVVCDQGAKAVVFTQYGQSVLRELERELRGLPVFTYHGGQSAAENESAKDAFRLYSHGAVLLASDAAARGINLPEASYVIEFDSALTHATRIQRHNRAHRINSAAGPVSALTLITEGTIEEGIFKSVLDRNEAHDTFTGDTLAGEGHVLAADRRALLAQARARLNHRTMTAVVHQGERP